MKQQYLAAAALATLALATADANALATGDLAFTSFNADEDGFSLVTFVDIAPNTVVYFSDNEFSAGAFNTGESYSQWSSGSATIAAGTVVRFSSVDSNTLLAASRGSLSRVTVASSANWGLSTSADTVYVYQGASATAPATFITAASNATDGGLAGTGLVEGVNAIRLNALVPAATPDFGQYQGARSGQASFAGYRALVNNVANWSVDTTNGNYAGTVPVTTAFSVTTVPEPQGYALMALGLAGLGFAARRRNAR